MRLVVEANSHRDALTEIDRQERELAAQREAEVAARREAERLLETAVPGVLACRGAPRLLVGRVPKPEELVVLQASHGVSCVVLVGSAGEVMSRKQVCFFCDERPRLVRFWATTTTTWRSSTGRARPRTWPRWTRIGGC